MYANVCNVDSFPEIYLIFYFEKISVVSVVMFVNKDFGLEAKVLF